MCVCSPHTLLSSPPRSDTTTTAPHLQVSSHCHQQRGTQGQKVHLLLSLPPPPYPSKFSLSFSARCDSDDQQELCGRGLCVDPEYDVLWSYSNQPRPTIACYNPVTTNLKGILTLHIQWNLSPFRRQSYSAHHRSIWYNSELLHLPASLQRRVHQSVSHLPQPSLLSAYSRHLPSPHCGGPGRQQDEEI